MQKVVTTARLCLVACGLSTVICVAAKAPNPYALAQAELHYFNEALANPARIFSPRVLVEIREEKKTEVFWLDQVVVAY